jgi:hypothetical protein
MRSPWRSRIGAPCPSIGSPKVAGRYITSRPVLGGEQHLAIVASGIGAGCDDKEPEPAGAGAAVRIRHCRGMALIPARAGGTVPGGTIGGRSSVAPSSREGTTSPCQWMTSG